MDKNDTFSFSTGLSKLASVPAGGAVAAPAATGAAGAAAVGAAPAAGMCIYTSCLTYIAKGMFL